MFICPQTVLDYMYQSDGVLFLVYSCHKTELDKQNADATFPCLKNKAWFENSSE